MNLSSLKRKSFKDYVDLRWYFKRHFKYPVDWACSKDGCFIHAMTMIGGAMDLNLCTVNRISTR